jgi:hypothetical protein
MAHSTELTLLELEEKMLAMVEQMWDSYERSEGGMPPIQLVTTITKLHGLISGRLKSKLGTSVFNPNDLEGSLLEIERIRDIVVMKIEQKHRMRSAS